jgi:hypothetical protein
MQTWRAREQVHEYSSEKSNQQQRPSRCVERKHEQTENVNEWKNQPIEQLDSAHHQGLQKHE